MATVRRKLETILEEGIIIEAKGFWRDNQAKYMQMFVEKKEISANVAVQIVDDI